MADSQIYFFGTGRPVTPQTNPRLNRDASRKGILQSGIRTISDFQQIIDQKLDVKPADLGRNAADIAQSFRSGIDVTA